MLGGKTALVITWAILLGTSGCAAQQRRVAGQTIGGVSALTTVTGLSIAAGCFPFNGDRDDWQASHTNSTETSCEHDDFEPNPELGLPLMTIGLSIAVLAGIVYATGSQPPRKMPPPPAEPPRDLPVF
jgi:hypothetical protein